MDKSPVFFEDERQQDLLHDNLALIAFTASHYKPDLVVNSTPATQVGKQ